MLAMSSFGVAFKHVANEEVMVQVALRQKSRISA